MPKRKSTKQHGPRNKTTPTVRYIVRFVADHDAVFEECNGESRPLTAKEYKENSYRACPDHPRAGSAVIDTSTNPPTVGCAQCGRTDYRDISYPEYLAYYGNPDRHVYLGCIAEKQIVCPCCDQPIDAELEEESVWGIDVMDDSPELAAVTLGHNYTAEEALQLPGCLADVARDELSELGWRQ